MEGELNNFILVWISVLTSLCCCYTIGKIIPKGTTRLISIIPIVCHFLILPLNLTTMSFIGTISFFITWLANFKLLLFAYGQGPLSSSPPMPLPQFILLACLPIKIQHHPLSENLEKPLHVQIKENPSHQITKKTHKSILFHYARKCLLLAIIFGVYENKEYVHNHVIMLLYCLNIYLFLEIMLAMAATMARAILKLELEPHFNEPHFSTSVQNFWGKRWNLMVSNILRESIYNPIKYSVSTRLVGKKWASIPGILVAFLVSGLMHELIFFYMGRVKPTWEVTCFFLVQGFSVALELAIKKVLNGKLLLPPVVSGPLALGFVVITSFWLFFPPLLRSNSDVRARREMIAFIEFVKDFTMLVIKIN